MSKSYAAASFLLSTLALRCAAPPSTSGGESMVVTGDCSRLPTDDFKSKCEVLLDNERRFVIPALEEASGISLKRCYDQITFSFEKKTSEDEPLGSTRIDAPGSARITYTMDLAEGWFSGVDKPVTTYDDHEPLHALYSCLGIPATANYDHTFFMPVQAEVDTIIVARGGPSAADASAKEDRYDTRHWLNEITKHLDELDQPGMFGGCHGAESIALYGQYVALGPSFVRTFFDAVIARGRVNRADPYDWGMPESEYADLVTNLTPRGTPIAREVQRRCYAEDGGVTSSPADAGRD